MTGPAVRVAGDAAIVISFDEVIDASVNARCIAIAADIERRRLPGVRDVVPGYQAVMVHFDPALADRAALITAAGEAALVPAAPSEASRVVEVRVRYGGEGGPDLQDVAAFAGCSESDVIDLHTRRPYRVFMLGFLPGFAYMGAVDPRIAMPRLDAPRLRVAAGSVGIAGAQTGVYPCESPGGWRIVGRTDAMLFDLGRPEPCLLRPGDSVRFVAA